MQLTPDQIEKVVQILNNRVSVFVGKAYGQDFLSSQQKEQLQRIGIDLNTIYKLHTDPFFLQYQLGMMSQVFTKLELNRYSFPQFLDAIRRGEYVKMSPREHASLKSLKMQSLADIRSFQGAIFSDVNNLINQAEKSNRQAYEKVIRRELKAGFAKRQSYKQIAQNLGNLTGDWARRWDRIVQYQGHLAFDEGRAAVIERKGGEDAYVYKLTYPGACKHCIKAYRTGDIESEPKIFKLSELKANGTNIGRKTADWLPVIGPIHPFCFSNKNTPIYTSEGVKSIKDIKVGDLVLTHKNRFRKVTNLIFTERKVVEGIYDIKFKNGGKISKLYGITGNHPVLTQRGWVAVKDLNNSDKLFQTFDVCSECGKQFSLTDKKMVNCSLICHNKYSAKKQWQMQGMREKMSKAASKGNIKRYKYSTIEERRKLTEKGRKKVKELYPNYNFLTSEETKKKANSSNGKRKTFIERKINHFLKRLKIDFVSDFSIKRNVKDTMGRNRHYFPDFYIPSLNVIIEADGEKWHNKEKDKKRDLEIKKLIGADTFRFTEHEILNEGKKVYEELDRIFNNHKGIYAQKEVEIISINKRKFGVSGKNLTKLYNFSVEEDESYVANGIVVHNCRCTLHHLEKGQEWDKELKMFVYPKDKEIKPSLKRSKVKMFIGEKEYLV